MNSRRRRLAAALSSIISDLLTILFPLLHSSDADPLSTTAPFDSDSFTNHNLPLIGHFVALSEIAAAMSIVTKKRKRDPLVDQSEDADGSSDELGRIGSGVTIKLSLPHLVRSPDAFKLCFKMSPSTFHWLSGLLEPLLDCRDPVRTPLNLPPELRLGIGLNRLATGSEYSEVGTRFGVSEFAARFCTKQLCRVLCTNYRFWVGFPGQESEIDNVASGFENLSGLPNCCGVITCCRFGVERSLKTIAAQILVDSGSRILSIAAGFHGDKSDYDVLKCSTLYHDVKAGALLTPKVINLEGVEVRQYFVGGTGYPLLPWLIIPFIDPAKGSGEERFNNAVSVMCGSAFSAVGSLRSWGVLRGRIDGDFKTGVKYIGACSILHNVLLMRDEEVMVGECLVDGEGSGFCTGVGLEEDEEGLRMRSALAEKARREEVRNRLKWPI